MRRRWRHLPTSAPCRPWQRIFSSTSGWVPSARRGPPCSFIHLMPAFGALLSVAFLGEAFYLYHALGIAGILAGVGLSTRGR
uniref:EamA family transporter n=1 Tax=Laribacter hongkongensis TaxID=168471 RepID=UPI0035716321